MADDYDGSPVADSSGEHIGEVERTYVDDAGSARFIAVKLGHLFGKHRLVPADQIEQDGTVLQVPYTRATIQESPHIDPKDTLEGTQLDEVRTYYASEFAGGSESDDQAASVPVASVDTAESDNSDASPHAAIQTETSPGNLGAVRDLGDVVEVPIIEEVLVKKQVVREVLRVKKSHISETGTASADLRSEDVEVVTSGQGLVRGDQTNGDTDTNT